MLYDNALLLRVGTHLLQAGGGTREADDELRRACHGIVRWLGREMTTPGGGFCAALDADSEGEEGRFYVWDHDELHALLGDADEILRWWGVTPEGNFEGRNILHVAREGRPPASLDDAARVLLEARERRPRPARDDKVLAAWNGLMLRALAEFARATDDQQARALALANGAFLFREMVRDDRVFRAHTSGVTRIPGFLEDHAAVALGALALYELTFDAAWLERSRRLAGSLVDWFWDDDASAFFDTARDHDELPTRPRDTTDNATPSGTSLAAELLLRLGDVLGEPDLVRRGAFVLETLAEPMARFPLAFGHALTAADLAVHGAVEVAIAGDPARADFRALARVLGDLYAPSLVVAGGAPDGTAVALLADRPLRDGRATAYVCRGFVCERPVDDPASLADRLRDVSRTASRP